MPGLDNDVLELRSVVEPAIHIERVLKRLPRRRRRGADLAGGDLLVLLLDGLDHVLRHQCPRLQLVRVEPDAHRVLTGAEYGDVADARKARQLVADIDGGIVAQEQAVISVIRRGQRDEQKYGGRTLLNGDALILDSLWQLRQRAGHAVLHQNLREVEVDADPERHGQGVAAVGAAI